jgi:hypothetical protein
MEKLVEANSFPYVQGGFSTVTPKGGNVVSLDLLNRGVGPAHDKSPRVKASGRYVTTIHEIVESSLGPEEATAARSVIHPMQDRMRARFIPGGQQQFVFRLSRTPENARYRDQLEASEESWDIEYCFCSVFDECWQVLGKWQEPAPIHACVRDEVREFLP